MNRPRVLLLDVGDRIGESLRTKGLAVTAGSLGVKYLEPRDDMPPVEFGAHVPNLVDQDIVVIDASEPELVDKPLSPPDKLVQSEYTNYFVPVGQNYVNSRPIVGQMLSTDFDTVVRSGGVVVVFCPTEYREGYVLAEVRERFVTSKSQVTATNLDYLPGQPQSEAVGSRIDRYVATDAYGVGRLGNVLERHKDGFEPKSVWRLGDTWNYEAVPVLQDRLGASLGLLIQPKRGEGFMLLLPSGAGMGPLLDDLILEVLPEITPRLFPELNEAKWLDDPRYESEQVSALRTRRAAISAEFEAQLGEVDQRIDAEKRASSFLTDVMVATATGDVLVDALCVLFEKMGIENVRKCVERVDGQLEEDIQIEHESGLLLVEAKGIAYKPTDDDCRQVQKYVGRHFRRGTRNPHGVFVVNSESGLPPHEREAIPFSPAQISDAETEMYSLVTTSQLVKAYRSLARGSLSTQDVVESLITGGVVSFVPQRWVSLGLAMRILPKASVLVLTAGQGGLRVGDEIGFCEDDEVFMSTILSMQQDDVSIEQAVEGDVVGIRVERLPRREVEIWRVVTPRHENESATVTVEP